MIFTLDVKAEETIKPKIETDKNADIEKPKDKK